MSSEVESARKKGEENVKNFKPSTKEEIDSFNLEKDDKCMIEVTDYCPFTSIHDTYETIAYVEDEMLMQDSSYELYFSYDDGYGQESWSKFEDARIIEKVKK